MATRLKKVRIKFPILYFIKDRINKWYLQLEGYFVTNLVNWQQVRNIIQYKRKILWRQSFCIFVEQFKDKFGLEYLIICST